MENLTYQGMRQPGGGSLITIVNPEGETLGVVRHIPKHSPTGMSWGFAGSGAADCARSLLLAALGDDANRCGACHGTGKTFFDPETDRELPYIPNSGHALDPDLIATCYDCDGTRYATVPYQKFKVDHVAGWGETWSMTRAQILAWLDTALGGLACPRCGAGETFNPGPEHGGPQAAYRAGRCGHRVAGTEWRAGFRVCECCTDPGCPGCILDVLKETRDD